MRTLKFRAWVGAFEYYTYDIQEREDMFEWFGQPTIHIEQYTGLRDKNGEEIYEGDIVEALVDGIWQSGRNVARFGKAKWKLEVIYNDIRFMNVLRVIGSKNAPDRIYYLFDKDLSELEVIGNIHENPELLNEEK